LDLLIFVKELKGKFNKLCSKKAKIETLF
jgi:hypothetical protein